LRSLGRVASREFEDRYEKVRRFLADVSTDHLNNFLRSHPRRDPEHQACWQELDNRLCSSFVDAWSIAEKGQAATGSDPYEAASLRSRVETWTLLTLMLTERPRDFSRYPLPHLTCLYRISTAEAMEDWNAAEEMPKAYSAVGAAELEAALTDSEYEWLNRNEVGLKKMEPVRLCDYLSREERSSLNLPPR
jgi:hypothetical protein